MTQHTRTNPTVPPNAGTGCHRAAQRGVWISPARSVQVLHPPQPLRIVLNNGLSLARLSSPKQIVSAATRILLAALKGSGCNLPNEKVFIAER